MRTIAVLNQKGGVGKTTTVANVAAALAMSGIRTLVIDLDPQAHLTIHLGADTDSVTPGVYEVLTGSSDIESAARAVRENLWVLGASINLVGAKRTGSRSGTRDHFAQSHWASPRPVRLCAD